MIKRKTHQFSYKAPLVTSEIEREREKENRRITHPIVYKVGLIPFAFLRVVEKVYLINGVYSFHSILLLAEHNSLSQAAEIQSYVPSGMENGPFWNSLKHALITITKQQYSSVLIFLGNLVVSANDVYLTEAKVMILNSQESSRYLKRRKYINNVKF